ncbi:MAG: hypothetical protein GY869_13780 [Planctomycetes bacterium]|nr:hypothetical protein [Planctomycetota bacterium]
MRWFRATQLVRTGAGLTAVRLFYLHADEVSVLLEGDRALSQQLRLLVEETLSDAGDDHGSSGTVSLTKKQYRQVKLFLKKLGEKGSIELRNDIDSIIDKIEAGAFRQQLHVK